MNLKQGKIEFLTLDFPPISGGISHYLYEIARHLPPERVRVIGVAVPDAQDFDTQQLFDVVRLRIPTSWPLFKRQLKFFSPFFFAQLIKDGDVAYIWCGQAHYSLLLPAWVYSGLKKIPFAVFCYGLDLLYPQTRLYRTVFNRLLRMADIVFVDSLAAKDIVLQLGVDSSKISVVYPTIDSDALQSVVTAQQMRERYNLLDKKCILTVGRIIERKGHDMVLCALPSILKLVPEAHYIIVGKGPHENELQKLVDQLQLRAHVTFAGYAAPDELGAYFSMCDVFTMISREIPETGDMEGFGIVYLQAGSFAKPVVAGKSGGVPDAVLHELTGLLVNPIDPDEVAQAIVLLLQDMALAKRLGEAGKRRIQAEFRSTEAAKKIMTAIGLE